MTTIGWIFILVGLIVMRQSIKGRNLNSIPGDIGSMLRGAATSLQSPTAGADIIKEVLARPGDSVTQTLTKGTGPTDITTANRTGIGMTVLATMKTLAVKANNRYVWGATGPNSYDCSGLVWAAMRSNGYSGLRFTTYTFVAQMGSKVTKIDSPVAGCVVLWLDHIGMMENDTTMYSALNPKDGIMSSPLTWGPKNKDGSRQVATFWNLNSL